MTLVLEQLVASHSAASLEGLAANWAVGRLDCVGVADVVADRDFRFGFERALRTFEHFTLKVKNFKLKIKSLDIKTNLTLNVEKCTACL